MITSYCTIDMGEYNKQYWLGKLYQKNITSSVIFTWRHAPHLSGTVEQSTPVENTKAKRTITGDFHLSLLSCGIRLLDTLLPVVCVQ
jgi:hypothetical protein